MSALKPEEQRQLFDFLERLTSKAASVNATYASDVRSKRHIGGTRHMW